MPVAQPGDLILLMSHDRKVFEVVLQVGARMQTHQGTIMHDDLIGQPLGRMVQSHLGRDFLVLPPSTHDLIREAERTTQIMFPKDIGYLLLRLNIHPGVRVIEAGTGSGGLAIALAQATRGYGEIYSYERRADVQQVARTNLARLGLEQFVTLRLKDIAAGFDEADVDALFIDVRDPWTYLPQCYSALTGGGFYGAILPTMNQVAHLLDDLSRHSFGSVEVEEVLLRPYKAIAARLRPMDRMVAHTGYLVFARKLVGSIREDWFVPVHGRGKAVERGDMDDYW